MNKKIVVFIIGILLMGIAIPTTGAIFNNSSLLLEPDRLSSEDQIFNRIIEFLMSYCHFPSISACIIKDDHVVWSKGYGFRDMESGSPATDSTIYEIASVTKTITGTALMQLYDQGFFDLDDDVNDYLPFNLRNPNFPDDPITLRMLLSHTSSLRNSEPYWNIDFIYDGPPFPDYPYPWLEEHLIPGGDYYDSAVWNANYPPGEKGIYANINFDLIAYLVDLISGRPFHEYCNENIFIPLGMFNTSFRLDHFTNGQLAIPYWWRSSVEKHYRMDNTVHIHYPAGGLRTSVLDLSHFMIAHMNDGIYNGYRILNESTVEEMHSIQPPGESQGIGFGLAWLITARMFWFGDGPFPFLNLINSGHGGDTTGFHMRMNMRGSGDIGIIYFINVGAKSYPEGWNGSELLNELLFLKANVL